MATAVQFEKLSVMTGVRTKPSIVEAYRQAAIAERRSLNFLYNQALEHYVPRLLVAQGPRQRKHRSTCEQTRAKP